jgi:hypothetical protein
LTRFLVRHVPTQAHLVTVDNMDETARWCGGHVARGFQRRLPPDKCSIRVPVSHGYAAASPGRHWIARFGRPPHVEFHVFAVDVWESVAGRMVSYTPREIAVV